MHGIYPAAVITAVVAALAWGALLKQLADPADRRWLLLLVALGLPLSVTAFYAMRLPLRAVVAQVLGDETAAMTAYRLCEAPLTEEPAKLAPLLTLLIPAFRGLLTRRNVVPVTLALGLGFGIGEIFLVAQFVASSGKHGDLPFYAFGGFFNERLIVCMTHAGFTVWSVLALQRSMRLLPFGLLAAMALHFAANFPIFLMNIEFGGISSGTWAVLVQVWILLFLVGTAAKLTYLHFGPEEFARLFWGRARCPSCQAIYQRPLFMALNWGVKRYERCPACKKWHWIDARDNIAASDRPHETPNADQSSD